ncbi:MAG: hypothetical protein O2807_02635 [bacterium]|nr:hypothetical protein [bacterium]
MSSLVEQLQAEALDSKISVTELLRKAKMVAAKLNLDDMQEWLENEMNGYKSMDNDDYPSYRIVTGHPQALNTYRGWEPLMVANAPDLERAISTRSINSSVAELEDLLKADGDIGMSFDPATKAKLQEGMNYPAELRVLLSRSCIAHILEAVRNVILDWSVNLEKAGIKGDGISFSQQEKEDAQNATTIHIGNITNFSGNIGNVSDQAVVNATQTNTFSQANLDEIRSLVSQMREYLPAVDLDDEDSVENEARIIEDELSAEQPDHARIRNALSSLGRILQGAAENIIVSGVIHQIRTILG